MNGQRMGRDPIPRPPSGPARRWIRFGLCLVLACAAPRAGWAMAWERGVEIGADAASFRGGWADLLGSEHRIGFVGGVFATGRISPRFGLRAELLYVMKGAKDRFEVTDNAGNVVGQGHDHWVLKYIEVPVLARVSLSPSARVRPELVFGPSLAVKLSGTLRSEAPGSPTTTATISQLKTFDLGVAAGFGISVGHGPVRWLLDVRYSTGLLSAFDSVAGSLDASNSVVSVMGGVSF